MCCKIFFSFCLFQSGGLRLQQLRLRSPKFVSQVRNKQEYAAFCLAPVKLLHNWFISWLRHLSTTILFYFIFSLLLTSPLVLSFFSWICLRDHFHCFAFCLQPLHCSSDYFVIRLINLVQTQFKTEFRQTPMHIQALTQWGLLQPLAQKITAKLPFHLSLHLILNSCLSVDVLVLWTFAHVVW